MWLCTGLFCVVAIYTTWEILTLKNYLFVWNSNLAGALSFYLLNLVTLLLDQTFFKKWSQGRKLKKIWSKLGTINRSYVLGSGWLGENTPYLGLMSLTAFLKAFIYLLLGSILCHISIKNYFPKSQSAWLCGGVVQLLSCIQLFAMLWTVARQAPLSMRFPRQEYWSGLPFPSPCFFKKT